MTLIFAPSPHALAAPPPGSLEEQCIAAGTVLPQEFQGFMFNHHPEKKREPRASDHYQTYLETVAEFSAVVPRMPDVCSGHFNQVVLGKAEFQATKSPGRWRSLRPRWEELPPSVSILEAIGDPPPLSSFGFLDGQQGLGTFGLGCTTKGRVEFKLEVVNEENQAIIAVRNAEMPLQVDSWFEARCLGKFSIQESSGAHRCGQVISAKAGKKPSLWGVKVRNVGCETARATAQAALETPSFLQGELTEQPLAGGWHCFYGHRGAASCQRGRSRVFLVERRSSAGEDCPQAPRGVRSLSQASTSCDIASQLAESVAASSRAELLLRPSAGGQTFTCAQLHYLGLGDRMKYDYVCVADGVVVSIQIQEPKSARVIPTPPSPIPPEVQFPPAGLLSFPRTPELKVNYSVVRHGQAVVTLEADPVLIGHQAEIESRIGTMKCEWTADPSDTDPTCGPIHRLGSPKTRTITLQAKQTIMLGLNRHRGNWFYDAYIRTKPFVADGIPYTHSVGYGYAYLVHDATNCSANPWCHNHKHQRPAHASSAFASAPGVAITAHTKISPLRIGRTNLTSGSDLDSAATAAFDDWIRGRFAKPEGIWECPQPQTYNGIVLCRGKFRSEGRWHSVSATAEGSGSEISFVHPFFESWKRRWTPYSAGVIRGFHLPGKASVNGRPAADWAFLAAGALFALRHRRSALVNSFDGPSEGFLNLVLFRCKRKHRLITCRNKLGDAMRYRPRAS